MLASSFWCYSYLPQCTLFKHYYFIIFIILGFGREAQITIQQNFPWPASWDYNKNLDEIMTHVLGFILQMYTSAFVSPPYCLAADVPGMQVGMARDSLEISSG